MAPAPSGTELEKLTRHLRETQHLLEESLHRYADLYDYAPVGYVALTRKGLIQEANATFAGMIGYEKRYLINSPFSILTTTITTLASFLDHLARCRQDHGRVVTELRLKRRDGSEFDVELSSTAIPDYRSRSTLYRTAVADISDRKRAERELQAAKDELELRVQERTAELTRAFDSLSREADERIRSSEELRMKEKMLLQQSRLAAMGEMIGNIAHQWRQPLNTLGLMFQSLPLEQELGTLTHESLDATVSQAMRIITHMSRTIDDFRDFFKTDKAWVIFDLKQSLLTGLSMIEAGMKEQRMVVDLQCQEGLKGVGFPNEYAQAVLNILMNARDVLRERRVDKPRITIRGFSEQDRAVVTIADNGGGIADGIIDRIFDPYFTTKEAEKGTGIGLFMSKMIIEKNMHGSLSARNTGEGAEFRVELAGGGERAQAGPAQAAAR